MNKYQKQAIVDMGKVAGTVVLAILVIGGVVQLGISAQDLVTVGSFGIMGYCIYQLFQLRVSQLENEDKRKDLEQRYK